MSRVTREQPPGQDRIEKIRARRIENAKKKALSVARRASGLAKKRAARGIYPHKKGARVDDFSQVTTGKEFLLGASITVADEKTGSEEVLEIRALNPFSGDLEVEHKAVTNGELFVRYRSVVRIEDVDRPAGKVEISTKAPPSYPGEDPVRTRGTTSWSCLEAAGLFELTEPFDG